MNEKNFELKYNKLISVIVPVYNVEKYLAKCLNSVIHQTYENLQIIIIDDGSTDHSGRICDEYSKIDERIQVIHQKNCGLSYARNAGLSVAKGEYIGFVDSDDWIHLDMYSHLIEIAEQYHADISIVEVKKVINDAIEDEKYQRNKIEVLTQKEYAKRYFKIGSQKILYYVWNRLYKRELFEANHFDERFSIGEDVIASYKAWEKANSIVLSKQRMYYYRQQSGMTSSFNRKYFLLADVWDVIVSLVKERTPEYYEYAAINRKRIDFTLLMELALSGEYRNILYRKNINLLLEELKISKKDLIRADISLSRKIMIEAFCINYYVCASIIFCMKKVRNRWN